MSFREWFSKPMNKFIFIRVALFVINLLLFIAVAVYGYYKLGGKI